MANPVWEVLQPLSTFPLIWANQNATPPSKPYATYKVTSGSPLTTIRTEPDAAGMAKLYAPMLLRLEVNFYGPGANAQARRVMLGLCTWASIARMEAQNLSVARLVTVNDLSGIVDDPQSQERASLEFTMNATDATDDLVGIIEHVVIEPDPAVPPGDPVWSRGCDEVISSPGATTPQPE